jgi:hypothetical protein
MFKFSATPKISTLSTRYLRCSVAATDSGAPVNPTASVVSFAFMSNDSSPASGDWKTGSWETAGEEYLARCLVGVGGAVVLPVGTYTVWLKLILAPETLVEAVGDVTIY